MNEYEPVLRRAFSILVPGHRVFIRPAEQPATGRNPLGFTVDFPVAWNLAARFCTPVWEELTAPLQYQMIAYLAGHEAMHAWETTQGHQPLPTTTLPGIVGNILADIRGDYLPVLDSLNNWPLNRELAYQILLEPCGEPADAAADSSVVEDAVRLLSWGLMIMRCGRLRCADGTETDSPADAVFASVWPRMASVLVQARHTSWRQEAQLAEELLDILWQWAHDRRQHTEEGESLTREEFERLLFDLLRDSPRTPCCMSREPVQHRLPPEAVPRQIGREALRFDSYRRAVSQYHRDLANVPARNELVSQPEEWAKILRTPDWSDIVVRQEHLVPLLAQHFVDILRPLLTAPAHQRCRSTSGSSLDLERQAGRIFVNAHHAVEHAPPIWLANVPSARRPYRIQCVTLVDCSGSMLTDLPESAPMAFATAAAMLETAARLDGLIDFGIAGFADEVMVIRNLADASPVATARKLLVHAQSIGDGTCLRPAITWARDQFAAVQADRRTRRLLLIITDARLDEHLPAAAAEVAKLDEDVLVLAVGLAEADHELLSEVVPAVVAVPPEQPELLPHLVRQVLEDVVRQDRVLG